MVVLDIDTDGDGRAGCAPLKPFPSFRILLRLPQKAADFMTDSPLANVEALFGAGSSISRSTLGLSLDSFREGVVLRAAL